MIPGLNVEHIADQLFLVDLLHGQIVLVPAAVLPGIEYLAGLFGNSHHVLQVLAAHHDRLFTEHMFAGPHSPNGKLLVAVVGGGYQHHVHPVVRQNFLEAVIGGEALLSGPFLAVLFDVIGAGQNHFVGQVCVAGEQFAALGTVGHPQSLSAAGGNCHGMAAAHTAATHNRNRYFAVNHKKSSSIFLNFVLSGKTTGQRGKPRCSFHIHTASDTKSQGIFFTFSPQKTCFQAEKKSGNQIRSFRMRKNPARPYRATQ